MDLRLENLFVENPPIGPNFQQLIGSKKEYYDQKLALKELSPEEGEYFKHQTIIHRFLRAYDELLIFHSTGTGKSLSVIGLTEFYKKNRSYIDRVFILVKGKTLRRELQHQIICSNRKEYETEKIRKSRGQKQRLNITLVLKPWYTIETYKKFAFSLRRKYWHKSKNDLLFIEEAKKKQEAAAAQKTKGRKSERSDRYWHLGEPDLAAIERDFSGSIFWIDEAHNLRVDPEVDYRMDQPKRERARNLREKEIVYQTLDVLFHTIKRSKKILTTATPMIDNPAEIQPLMNLILPYDQRIKGINFETVQLPELVPYFNGRVSYVRAFETGANPKFLGNQMVFEEPDPQTGEIIPFQTVIYDTNMSDHQNDGYIRSRTYQYPKKEGEEEEETGKEERKTGKEEESEEESESDLEPDEEEELEPEPDPEGEEDLEAIEQAELEALEGLDLDLEEIPEIQGTGLVTKGVRAHGVYTPERQASNFVFPDGSFGPEGFKKYVNKLATDSYVTQNGLDKAIQTVEQIRELSCKYGDICDRLQLIRDEKTGKLRPKTPGNFFIYGEILEGSGLIVLTLCLEAMGYKKFTASTSIFGVGEEEVEYCASRRKRQVTRKTNIDPEPMYALIGKDTSDGKLQTILETMNSYENRHGDFIKILLSSPMGKEGINVNNVLNIEIIDSEWNPSGTFQALSRGLRATSHEDLLKEKALETKQLIEDVTLDVNIRLHSAMPQGNVSSINLDMYFESEKKDRQIKRIERFMKQIAFDWWLNYDRNVREGDQKYSVKCDYQKECSYPGINPPPNLKEFDDRSTYDLLYADPYLELIGRDIIEYFKSNFNASLEELYLALQKYEHRYIDLALDKLIRSKTQLLDRFGYASYLREESGMIYLSREYPIKNREKFQQVYPLLGYFSSLNAESETTISDLATEILKPEELEKAESIQTTDPQFDQKIDSLDISVKVDLLENALVNLANGKATEKDEAIEEKFRFYWYITSRPENRIKETLESMSSKGMGQGKKAGKGKGKGKQEQVIRKISRTDIEKVQEETGEREIYIHILWLLGDLEQEPNLFKHMPNFLKAETRYRLFEPGKDDKFRDASPYETKVYNEIIQKRISELLKPYFESDKGVYGSVVLGRFRVHNIKGEKAKAKKDNRYAIKGRVCRSFNIGEIVGFLWQIGKDNPEKIEGSQVIDQMSRAEMIDRLSSEDIKADLTTFTNEKLRFFMHWYWIKFSKPKYCQYLQEGLIKEDLIFIP